MTPLVGQSVVCPVLVGRAPFLATLDEQLERACGGAGATVLLTGEAGIGKSRLVAEVRARAQHRGMALFEGHCYETDRVLPYAPFLDLLHARFSGRHADEVAQEVGRAAPELLRLLPELGAAPPDVVATLPPDPEQEKRRLFQAFVRYFAERAAERPVLVIIEDLHWVDDSSLDLLLLLARRLANSPVLLLLTYRSDEVDERLRHFLASLDRERLAGELPLQRLAPTDVDAMVRAILALPQAAPSDLLHVLHALTDGNPFFVEECLKTLLTSGDLFLAAGRWRSKPFPEWQVPRTVHDAVQRRARQLSPDAHRVLTIAAAIGQRCDFALLREVAGLDEGTLLASLKELIAAQLLVEDAAEQFAFRHALTRQAIYTHLLGRERRLLHRAIVAALERLAPEAAEQHAASLASHAFEAGAWAQALVYARRAAEQAQALHAPRAVVEHCTRALEAARHAGASPPRQVHHLRGSAHEALGEFAQARADYEAALQGASADRDDRGRWQALLDLGAFWAGHDYTRAGVYLRQALDLARALDEPTMLAHSLNRLGNWLANTGQLAEGLAVHREALAIFEAHNNIAGQAETLDLLGMAHGIDGDMPASVEYAARAIALWPMVGPHPGWVSSLGVHSNMGGPALATTTYSPLRSVEQTTLDLLAGLKVAQQLDWPAGEAFLHTTSGSGLAAYGEFGTGLAHAHEGLRIAREIGHQQWAVGALAHLGQIYSRMLTPERTVQCAGEALALARALNSAWWIGFATGFLAIGHLLAGTPEHAATVLERAEPLGRPPRGVTERQVVWARGELALAQGDPATAIAIADQLLASAPGAHQGQPIPWLLKLKGEALLALDCMSEAIPVLEDAKRGALERQERPVLWQIQRALARAYQRARQSDRAQEEVAAARAVVASLAATIDEDALREQFLSAALASLPRERPPTPLQAAKEAAGGLTARERAVAALIAQGKSNREIAEALVVSEPTVATHVSHILAKLGATSRAQIGAWVGAQGTRHAPGAPPEKSSPVARENHHG